MLHLQSIFRQVAVFSFSLSILISCKDIPRDNILDPKNPNSYRDQVISLEAFVNTENDQMYNEYMLSAMQTVADRYAGKILLIHYHRNTNSFTDTLAIPENESLYEQYVNKFDGLKGVPDVFINGTVARVKGASNENSAIDRLDNAIQPLLIENTFFTIEPNVSKENTNLSISTKIARLGSESISDIIVRATITEQFDSGYYTRVVRHIENSNLIPRLQPGEQKEIKYEDQTVRSESDLQVIFSVMSYQTLIVFQSTEVSVQ
jgi:hypothetical protein